MSQNSAVRGSLKRDHPGLINDHFFNPLAKHGETLKFQFNNNVYIRIQNYLNVGGQYILYLKFLKIWVIVGAQYNENLSANHHKLYIFLN